MKQYKEMLAHILENGKDKSDRTGVGTRSVFGYQNRFDLSAGRPCIFLTSCLRQGAVCAEVIANGAVAHFGHYFTFELLKDRLRNE